MASITEGPIATSSATNADTMTLAILSFMPFSFHDSVFYHAMPSGVRARVFAPRLLHSLLMTLLWLRRGGMAQRD